MDILLDEKGGSLNQRLSSQLRVGQKLQDDKCIAVTPLSFRSSYRSKDHMMNFNDGVNSLQELALPLSLLVATACAKEEWWNEKMLDLKVWCQSMRLYL